MALSLPFVRRRPPPRHAAPHVQQPAPPKRRGDGTTLGVILVLVLTSGFVAGTTATFSGTTTNANVFASVGLGAPADLKATPQGINHSLTWTNATGTGVDNTGYRISVADFQQAPATGVGLPVSCTTAFSYLKITGSNTTSYLDSTTATTTTHPNAYVDGRMWCYKLETVYPYPENTNPWLSQLNNPTTTIEIGNTITGVTLGTTGVANAGVFTAGINASTDSDDYIEFTFSQPISNPPSGALCLDGANDRIWVGMSNTTSTTACGTTSVGETFRGFVLTGGTISGTLTSRYPINASTGITYPACDPLQTPPGCFRMRIKVRARTGGTTDPTIGGTWLARGSSTTSPVLMTTTSGSRNFCAAGTSTTVGAGLTANYRADPTTPAVGRCSVSGIAVNW